MKFDLGNIFYIVITLVAVIVGLLGKKKKPVGKGSGGSEGAARPGFLDNLEKAFNFEQPDQAGMDLRDYEEDGQSEMENEVPIPVAGSEPMSLTEEYEQLMGERMDRQADDRILTGSDLQTESLEIVDLDGEEGVDYFEAVRDFDAGTAVIYSAIINRLDY